MSTSTSYDYIIAGAGAAGLSLAHALLSSDVLSSKRILIIDKTLDPAIDKTWSFWADPSQSVTHFAYRSWQEVTVTAFHHHFHTNLKNLRYFCVKSEDFTAKILSEIQESPQITLLKASIEKVIAQPKSVTIYTNKGEYSGEWCFQSVIKKPQPTKGNQKEIELLQHFMGWEIQTKKPIFNKDEVILMDFDTQQGDGVTFFYILPFSKNYALIEHTMFSDSMLSEESYEEQIKAYLSKKFHLQNQDYQLVRKELGAIPMESTRFASWLNPRTMSIGMVGGHTKPSTGYTFMRIQKQVQSIVTSLEKNEKPFHDGASRYRFRIYDMMLLSILDQDPKMGVKIFHDLFKKNSMELVFKFLDERTHFLEELKIFSTLPYMPFLKAIYQLRSRILNGA